MRLSSTIFALLASLSGCAASIQATAINRSPVPMTARPVDSVEVFTSGPPSRPHTDILLLEVKPGYDANTTPEEIALLRQQAAAMGCDAVVINGVQSQIITDHHAMGERTTVNGTCIMYTAPAVAEP